MTQALLRRLPDQPSPVRPRLGAGPFLQPAYAPALFLGSLGLECLSDSTLSQRSSISRDTCVCPLSFPSLQSCEGLRHRPASRCHCVGQRRCLQRVPDSASALPRTMAEGLLASPRV